MKKNRDQSARHPIAHDIDDERTDHKGTGAGTADRRESRMMTNLINSADDVKSSRDV
ncbi:hypothetical protein SERLA73DRAFT_130649 [Serpula lacrymans var. lacrymans S7.3]|uniref:Uncharacterized protein n=2 Tax=Serpula lacrymans var. lacrymans TaxID=341189 RepID=F8PLB9_SERL3|nr:uncharacterized protein SERLADRAFT_379544 [Serpula lacrymans var. lacrymans S7.9]EGO04027.1 hypothetical protein SERLA73DRAFT_130649 [Serpula lacrymans var. lacrymans S7.3]EGO29944.1 hypothetical protein SERLADRAFT_379544 [Serpula lacrymans var. lacrymans S7.9]